MCQPGDIVAIGCSGSIRGSATADVSAAASATTAAAGPAAAAAATVPTTAAADVSTATVPAAGLDGGFVAPGLTHFRCRSNCSR